MYQEQALTVFDLTEVVSPQRPGEDRRARRNGPAVKPQILILHSPHNHEKRFGILIDNLGDITEIPLSQIEAVPEMMSSGRSLIDSLVKPQGDKSDRRILMVLSVEKIMTRLSERDAV